jgi:hypothetical protein
MVIATYEPGLFSMKKENIYICIVCKAYLPNLTCKCVILAWIYTQQVRFKT